MTPGSVQRLCPPLEWAVLIEPPSEVVLLQGLLGSEKGAEGMLSGFPFIKHSPPR